MDLFELQIIVGNMIAKPHKDNFTFKFKEANFDSLEQKHDYLISQNHY